MNANISSELIQASEVIEKLKSLLPTSVFSWINENISVTEQTTPIVRSPRQVIMDKKGTAIEINELLFQVLARKYDDLVLCFYQIVTPRGMVYHSHLMHRHRTKHRWICVERTNQWLTGKIDGLVGTCEYILDEVKAQLQNHYNGVVNYRATGIVCLSGAVSDINDYFEKIKRFYVME